MQEKYHEYRSLYDKDKFVGRTYKDTEFKTMQKDQDRTISMENQPYLQENIIDQLKSVREKKNRLESLPNYHGEGIWNSVEDVKIHDSTVLSLASSCHLLASSSHKSVKIWDL